MAFLCLTMIGFGCIWAMALILLTLYRGVLGWRQRRQERPVLLRECRCRKEWWFMAQEEETP